MADGNERETLRMYDDDALFWTYDGKEYCLRVMSDPDPDDPRADDEGLITTMACFHRRHTSLGDRTGFSRPGAFVMDLLGKYAKADAVKSLCGEGGFPAAVLAAIAERIDLPVMTPTPIPPKSPVRDAIAFIGGLAWSKGAKEPEPKHVDIDTRHPAIGELADLPAGLLLSAFLDAVEDEDLFDAAFQAMGSDVAALPLWLYDHSGLTVSAGDRAYPYDDRWDSCQLGWIIAEKPVVMERCGCPEGDWLDRAIAAMRADVEAYDQYLTGDVYWYQLYERPVAEDQDDDEGWEESDSCSGFYGSDVLANGILDNAGNGIGEAVASGSYRTGKVEREAHATYSYSFRKD